MSNNTLTETEKTRLSHFWETFYESAGILQDFPYEPSFGHYPHTLELREPANLIFTDPEDNAGKPDDHYYQAAGQEPPTESQDDDGSAIRGVVYLTLFYAFLAVVVMLLVPCIWNCW